MKTLEPGDIIENGISSYCIDNVKIHYPLDKNGYHTLTIETSICPNSIGNTWSFTEDFLMLKKMLIAKNILTEEEIKELIDAGFVMEKLTK